MHGFNTVIDDIDSVCKLGSLQGGERKLYVIGTVINDQYIYEFIHV
jgi:hypothetical protein